MTFRPLSRDLGHMLYNACEVPVALPIPNVARFSRVYVRLAPAVVMQRLKAGDDYEKRTNDLATAIQKEC